VTFDELKRLIVPSSGDSDLITPALELSPLVPADQMVAALATYFGEDDRRDRIAITIGGQPAGYLPRQALYDAFTPVHRDLGFGESGHASLPGRGSFRVIRLQCSFGGCNEQKLVMSFDEQEPPSCPRHPDAPMRPVV
jgi:hypothetical protein